MAQERINPFELEDKFAMDHLHRYFLLKEMVVGKTVLDAACGVGFGSGMMANWGAKKVVGLDIDEAAIGLAKANWSFVNSQFQIASLESAPEVLNDRFDIIASFETLEHVQDLETALKSMKQLLANEGVFIGSVPGESDIEDENAYHLRHFNMGTLEKTLSTHFKNVKVMRQDFLLAVQLTESDGASESFNEKKSNLVQLDFVSNADKSGSLFFIASNESLPELDLNLMVASKTAWQIESNSLKQCRNQLDQLTAKYQHLFAAHGDLKRRFTNMMGWGQYHYQLSNKKEPEAHYLDVIENAKSTREVELMNKVKSLQEEIKKLNEALTSSGYSTGNSNKIIESIKGNK